MTSELRILKALYFSPSLPKEQTSTGPLMYHFYAFKKGINLVYFHSNALIEMSNLKFSSIFTFNFVNAQQNPSKFNMAGVGNVFGRDSGGVYLLI